LKETKKIETLKDLEELVDMWRPKRPWEPYPDECCGKGCVPCVYDIYEDNITRYEFNLK